MRKNKIKKIITVFMTNMILISMFSSNIALAQNKPTLTLTPQNNNANNYIGMNWTTPDTSQKYTYMLYSKGETDSEYQTIPAKENIKVLNIYPNVGNNLKTWMETNGYGKGKIAVDEVTVDDFNNNPSLYLGTNGNWKYDVIYEGAWDCNNNKDLTNESMNLIKNFIESGRGYLGGHDTFWNYSVNRNGLSSYLNIEPNTVEWICSSKIKVKKKGLLTSYPWIIGDINTVLSVPNSHSTGQFAKGDIWMNYYDDGGNWYPVSGTINSLNGVPGSNNFYLQTWNNTAMIQTGHSNGQATEDEQKILANTLFYLAQVTEATNWSDHKGQDLKAPNSPAVKNSLIDKANHANLTIESADNGSTYSYYVEATGESNHIKTQSDTKSTTITSGIKGYSYVIDKNPSTIPDNNININSSGAVNISADVDLSSKSYLHVKAIDNAGNASSVTNYVLEDTINPTLNITYNKSNEWTKSVVVNMSASDSESLVDYITLPNGNKVYNTNNSNPLNSSFTITVNGSYNFSSTDRAGNTTTKTVVFKNDGTGDGSDGIKIDSNAPSLTITSNAPTSGWSKEPITITATASDGESGIASITLPDGTTTTKSPATITVSENGNYTFKVTDKVGNTVTKTITIGNGTNGNGTFGVDISNPSIDVTLDKGDGWTNKVIATVTGSDSESGIDYIIMPDGSKVTGGNGQFAITGEGNYTFKVVDKAGNEETKTITINNSTTGIKIDTEAPKYTYTTNVDMSKYTNKDITINFNVTDNLSSVKRTKLPNGNYVSGANPSYTISQNGTYTFIFEDNAGNTKTLNYTVSNIDKSAPTISSSGTSISPTGVKPGEWTSTHPVTITPSASDNVDVIYQYNLTGATNSDGWKSYGNSLTITNEGLTHVQIRAIDSAGNISNELAYDIMIDYSAPALNVTSSRDWTSGVLNLQVSITDPYSGIKRTQLPDGTYSTASFLNYNATKNGTYTFITEDNIGNKKTYNVVVANVDNEAPTLKITPNPSTWTNKDVILGVVADDNGGSGVLRIQTPDGNWQNKSGLTYTVSQNGTYTFKVQDKVGNIGTYSYTVTNIDKSAPNSPSISVNTDWTSAKSVPVSITAGADSGSGIDKVLYRTVGSKTSGWKVYSGSFNIAEEGVTRIEAKTIDKVGNISSVAIKEVKIDWSAPINNDIVIERIIKS